MSKLVSLSEEAYKTLERKKRKDESFSDVVVRELGNKTKPDIMKFAGIFKDKEKEWIEIEKEIYKTRKTARMRDF